MRIITGFEDKPFKEDPGPCDEGFAAVFKALSFSHEVAENAFTCVAKKIFRTYTEGGRFVEVKDARELRPTWVAEASVILVNNAEEVTELQRLIASLGEAFLATEISLVALIEPLKCHIQIVGKRDYKFTIKQIWAPYNG